MSPATEPKCIGTLVCVVLKARNLPNKRSIGKQDPYCVLTHNGEVQKTDPDKRGGQHPQWDAQLNFEIFEDAEDQLQRNKDSTIKASSIKKHTPKTLKVSAYADDKSDPEIIGEGIVDLTDTLKTGEFDEWVPIKHKERYAGEVYLELTFYSAAAPPKKKKAQKPLASGTDTYGGAGTFVEDVDSLEDAPKPPAKPSSGGGIPSSMRPGGHLARPSNASGMSSSRSHSQLGGGTSVHEVPSSLRPSSSLAHIDAYVPPYAPPSVQRAHSPAPPRAHSPAPPPPRAPSPQPPYHEPQRRDTYPPHAHPHELPVEQHYAGSVHHQPPPPWHGSADPTEDLLRPMSSMSFAPPQHSPVQSPAPYNQPPPPASFAPYAQQQPPQAYNYAQPASSAAHRNSLPPNGGGYHVDSSQPQYAGAPLQPPPALQSSYSSPGPTHHRLPHQVAPQAQDGGGHHYVPTPSPVQRPHTATGYHALPEIPAPGPPTASVINAQSYYQPAPRVPSPAPSMTPSVTNSQISYAAPPAPQSFFAPPPQQGAYGQGAAHASPPFGNVRPLPSTQPPPGHHSPAPYGWGPPPPPPQQGNYGAPQYAALPSAQYAPQPSVYGAPPAGYAAPSAGLPPTASVYGAPSHSPAPQGHMSYHPQQPQHYAAQAPPPPPPGQGYYQQHHQQQEPQQPYYHQQ